MGKRGPQPQERRITSEHVTILEWIAKGRTNPEIAGLMCQTEFWVNDQLKVIFQVLGVRTRAQAVAVAMRNKLLRLPKTPW